MSETSDDYATYFTSDDERYTVKIFSSNTLDYYLITDTRGKYDSALSLLAAQDMARVWVQHYNKLREKGKQSRQK